MGFNKQGKLGLENGLQEGGFSNANFQNISSNELNGVTIIIDNGTSNTIIIDNGTSTTIIDDDGSNN